MEKNKIIIAGGTGFLGASIIRKYFKTETEVVVLSRRKLPTNENIRYVQWDAENLGEWAKELESATAVINLTGKSVNCRYNEKNKKEIIESRVLSTLAIGKAIQNCVNPPKVWINAGSAAIFGNSGDEIKYEDSKFGNGFSPEVCKKWEQAFDQINTPSTRKIFLRIGLVLQKEGGILKPFINMVKFGVGGTIGSGNQYLTWIHEDDFIGLIDWVINNKNIQGKINCASPNPVKNSEFMKALRAACKIPFGIPNPAFLVRMGAVVIGTEAELILSGRRVVSKVLSENQFQFKYPVLKDALGQLI